MGSPEENLGPGGEGVYPFGVVPGPPDSINETVLAFVREALGLDAAPVFVSVALDSDAKPLDCFSNVERRIERKGGSRRYGWLIWQHGDGMVEGEFHCLWLSPTREFVDVTPHDGETTVLFVPDSNRRYHGGEPYPNVRRYLRDDEETRLVQQRLAELDEFKRHPPPNVIFRGPLPLKAAQIGRNDPCPCTSGRKYKKCCWKLEYD